jgi:RNA polymerase sigma-70 factor (ECF subfamily)
MILGAIAMWHLGCDAGPAMNASRSVASESTRRQPAMSELRRALVALGPDLRSRALRLARNPAEADDVVQDTLERAMRFESHFIPGTNARAWLFQILSSVFVTRCRRARREHRALGHLATDPCAWTVSDQAPTMRALTPSVRSRLQELPASFRRAVELVDLEEMSYRDAAERMGVPVGTVMSRLHRGRKLLASSLREREPAPQALAA